MCNNMIQTITLVFEDGSKATFTGPAIMSDKEQKRIVEILFTEPQELPEGCSWSKEILK